MFLSDFRMALPISLVVFILLILLIFAPWQQGSVPSGAFIGQSGSDWDSFRDYYDSLVENGSGFNDSIATSSTDPEPFDVADNIFSIPKSTEEYKTLAEGDTYTDFSAIEMAYLSRPTSVFEGDPILINISLKDPSLSSLMHTWKGINYTLFDDDLLLMLNFDEITHLDDSSMYANHGSCVACPGLNVSGVYGEAYDFAGGDYIVADDSYLPMGNSSRTIEAWVKWDGDTGRAMMFGYGSDGGGQAYGYRVDYLLPGYVEFVGYNVGDHQNLFEMSAGVWTYIASTYNGTHVRTYANGSLVAEQKLNLTTMPSHGFRIGWGYDSWPTTFQGSIDGIRVWNRTLTDDEISFNYMSNLRRYAPDTWNLNINDSERNITVNEPVLDAAGYFWNGTPFIIYNDSLVIMYNYENLSSLGERSGHVFDLSGHGNNASPFIPGNLPTLTPGAFGKAYSFPGEHSSTFLIATDAFELPQGASPRTMELWFNYDGSINEPGIFGWGSAANEQACMYRIDGYMLHFIGFNYYNGPTFMDYDDIYLLSGRVGEWVHLIGVFDGTYLRTYIDGKLEKIQNFSRLNTQGFDFKIGEGYDNDIEFSGAIDEVRIWDIALDQETVQQHHMSNLGKVDFDNWSFFVDQMKNATDHLSPGDYTYRLCARDSLGRVSCTDITNLRVNERPGPPQIQFVPPTPDSGTSFWSPASFSHNSSINASNIIGVLYNYDGGNYSLLDSDLILAYNFDNVSTLGENATHVLDFTGNGFDATMISEGRIAQWTPDGRYGGAFDFEGSPNWGDGAYLIVNNSNTSNFNVVDEFSVEVWFKKKSLSQGISALVSRKNDWTTNENWFLDFVSNERLEWAVGNATTEGSRVVTDNVSLGEWHHGVGVYDNGELRVYLDGVLEAVDNAGLFYNDDSLPVVVGRAFSTRNMGYFNGTIDEVRIWSKALSDDEVAIHYRSNLKRISNDNWTFEANVYESQVGRHTYQSCASTDAGSNCTEENNFSVLVPYSIALADPLVDTNVEKDEFFSFSVLVSCLSSDCGDLSIYLDPIGGCDVQSAACTSSCNDLTRDYLGEGWYYNTSYGICADESFTFPAPATRIFIVGRPPTCDAWGIPSASSDCVLFSQDGGTTFYVCPSYDTNDNKTVLASDCICNSPPCAESAFTSNFNLDNEFYTGPCNLSYANDYGCGGCSVLFEPSGVDWVYFPPGIAGPFDVCANTGNQQYIAPDSGCDGIPNLIGDGGPCASVVFGGNQTVCPSYVRKGSSVDFEDCVDISGNDPDPRHEALYDFSEVWFFGDLSVKGLVSSVEGALPFFTTDSNPHLLNLDHMGSEIVTFSVNATGNVNNTYEFFAYVRGDSGVRRNSGTVNITIVEAGSSSPAVQETNYRCNRAWVCGAWGECELDLQYRDCDCGCADDTDCYGDHNIIKSCQCEVNSDCDDENVCTREECIDNECVYSVSHVLECDDLDPCTVDDVCAEGACRGKDVCGGEVPPITDNSCSLGWDCGPWSSCDAGIQSRICECSCDELNCDGIPQTSRPCQPLRMIVKTNTETPVLGDVLKITVFDELGNRISPDHISLQTPSGNTINLSEDSSSLDELGTWIILASKDGFSSETKILYVSAPPGADLGTKPVPESIAGLIIKNTHIFTAAILVSLLLFFLWGRRGKNRN